MKNCAIPTLICSFFVLSLSSCEKIPAEDLPSAIESSAEESLSVSERSSIPSSSSLDEGAPTLSKLKFELGLTHSFYVVSAAYDSIEGNVVIPSVYDGLPVRHIKDWGFSAIKKLTSIYIPESVTSIGEYAFYACPSLTSVTLNEGLDNIHEYAFFDCNSLSSVSFPDSLGFIDEYAFCECDSLERVEIGSELYDLKTGVFARCRSLSTFIISKKNRYFSVDDDGVVYNKDRSEIVAFPLTKDSFYIHLGVTSIGGGAFSDAPMKTLNIPSTVRTIGESAFDGCENLETINFGSNVETIGEMAFAYCIKLGEVTFPSSIRKIGYNAFMTCNALKTVVIPDCPVAIENSAFADCPILESVSIGRNVSSIGSSAFGGCPSLRTVSYGGTMSDWESVNKAEDWNRSKVIESVVCADGTISLIEEN